MSISLEKRTEAALVSLQKIAQESPIDLGDVCAQVTITCDRSGSTADYWPDMYQEAGERALALTLTGLDDDGVVPAYIFDHRLVGSDELTAQNYQGWFEHFHRTNGSMGGTRYGVFLEKLLGGAKKKFFGKKPDEKNEPPFFHLVLTDGEPGDPGDTERLLVAARTRPHFFQFVMIGDDRRGKEYLRHLSEDLQGPGIDNVGVTYYDTVPPTDDTAFFNDVIKEFFTQWLPEARKQGITNK